MDEGTTNRDSVESPRSQTTSNKRVPYRRTVPHVSQAPITDESLATPSRPINQNQTATGERRAAPGGRVHMGVATNDPQYLPKNGPAHPRRSKPGERQQLHYDRYLQTPNSKKSIFVARQERARRHAVIVIVAIAVLAVLALWFIFFR